MGNEDHDSGTSQHITDCRRCEKPIMRGDEWWQHSWEERASKEVAEKALEDMEFRDWFKENIVLCPTCHKDVVEVILRAE